jgi:tRNA 2-thiouridine synthesizing protein B
MLHIVNKSPFQTRTLESCLRVAQPGHALLLTEDAVIAATRAVVGAALGAALGTLKVYVLQPDLEARGLAGQLADGVTPVDYAGFVDLVVEQPRNQSWL